MVYIESDPKPKFGLFQNFKKYVILEAE
jgi:hypothetical protein